MPALRVIWVNPDIPKVSPLRADLHIVEPMAPTVDYWFSIVPGVWFNARTWENRFQDERPI